MKQNKKNQKGFTLIELIIVIAIMGILAAVLVPSFTQMTAKAKISTDLRSIQTLQKQLDLYAAEHGSTYPTGADKTAAALAAVKNLYKGQYIESKITITGDSAIVTGTSRNLEKVVGIQSDALIVLDGDAKKGVFKLDSTSATGTTQKILESLAEEGSSESNLIYTTP